MTSSDRTLSIIVVVLLLALFVNRANFYNIEATPLLIFLILAGLGALLMWKEVKRRKTMKESQRQQDETARTKADNESKQRDHSNQRERNKHDEATNERARQEQHGSESRREQSEWAKREQDAREKAKPWTTGAGSSITDALELFELSVPFSLDALQKRRKQLLLKVHPDHGGSAVMTRMVNDAYEMLLPKAS